MTIVKILVDAVGEYNAGNIVHDAPDGLIEIAKRKFAMQQLERYWQRS